MNFLKQGSSGVLWYAFFLILVYLVFTNWKGANKLLGTTIGGSAALVETFQGRKPRLPF